eukprot:gene5210-5740_t
MFKLLLGLLLASSAVAFTFHPASARVSSMALQAEKSKAVGAVGYPVNLQLLVGMGIIELATWEKTFHGQTAGKDSMNHFLKYLI